MMERLYHAISAPVTDSDWETNSDWDIGSGWGTDSDWN